MPNEFRTSVGGQALMEGIMMRGPEKICCAVRKPVVTIDLTYDKVVTRWYNKVPLLRGVCNMAENLYKGYKYLMHAADVAMEGVEDAEPESKLDKWLDEHTGPVFQNVLMTCAAFARYSQSANDFISRGWVVVASCGWRRMSRLGLISTRLPQNHSQGMISSSSSRSTARSISAGSYCCACTRATGANGLELVVCIKSSSGSRC